MPRPKQKAPTIAALRALAKRKGRRPAWVGIARGDGLWKCWSYGHGNDCIRAESNRRPLTRIGLWAMLSALPDAKKGRKP